MVKVLIPVDYVVFQSVSNKWLGADAEPCDHYPSQPISQSCTPQQERIVQRARSAGSAAQARALAAALVTAAAGENLERRLAQVLPSPPVRAVACTLIQEAFRKDAACSADNAASWIIEGVMVFINNV